MSLERAAELGALDVEARSLFDAAPASLVLSCDFTIVVANEAYLRVTRTTSSELLGRELFQLFPDVLREVQGDGIAALRSSLQKVVSSGKPSSISTRFDVRCSRAAAGTFEERHWIFHNTPVHRADGQLAYIVHNIEDTTELIRLRQESVDREHAIREASTRSEQRYRQLLDAAPDAIVVVGADGQIDLVNLQTEHLFGYSREELLGRRLEMLIPARFRAGHRSHLERFFAAPNSRPMGSGLSLFGLRKDGVEIPIEVSLSPLRTEEGLTISAAIRDITERKKLEESSRKLADRLASAVESIQDAFALFDDDDRLVLCNSVYRALIGDRLQGPIVGRSYRELLDAWILEIDFGDNVAKDAFRQERLDQRGSATTTFDIRMRDGRRLRVIDRRTAEGGIVKTIWDLTDDERRAQELREARAAAEAGSAAKSEFLSSMSHELRTPLNAILGFAQLLQRDKKEPLSTRHKERAEHILKGGEHLLRLIDDILDLSRIEAGRVSISTEPVRVADVLEEVRRTLDTLASRQGVGLTVEPVPRDLPYVSADRTRFAQILMNFGSNAIKYNRPGGTVTFFATPSPPSHVRVTVRDTGMGIPEESQGKLFQPFQRAGQETGPIEGTGIGLVITKRLAELMNGLVGFQSVVGEGSEFWVEMPCDLDSTSSVITAAERERLEQAGAGPQRMLILYVEDNPANVTFMRDLVGAIDGVDLLTAPTAELGLEVAKAQALSAIIMDVNLPGMSGVEALGLLRADPKTRNVPVIALTAAASERDRQRGLSAGFYRYLTKPVNVEEFVTTLEALPAARH